LTDGADRFCRAAGIFHEKRSSVCVQFERRSQTGVLSFFSVFCCYFLTGPSPDCPEVSNLSAKTNGLFPCSSHRFTNCGTFHTLHTEENKPIRIVNVPRFQPVFRPTPGGWCSCSVFIFIADVQRVHSCSACSFCSKCSTFRLGSTVSAIFVAKGVSASCNAWGLELSRSVPLSHLPFVPCPIVPRHFCKSL